MDKLSRLSANTITSGSNTYTINYTYTDVSDVANKTTTLLKTIKNGNNDEIAYTYDALGNIEIITKGSTLTNKYYYDELSQLVREDNVEQNKTITYEYDAGGNILNKKEYSYTDSTTLPATPNKTIVYAYGNTNWKDQLTSYDGRQITYDEIGNALTYDGNTYSWQNGRQLAGISNTEKGLTTSYKYNDSGIRTQKTVNGTTTNYYVEGSKVIYEQTGDNIIYYTYDENGNVVALKYNDTQYYYIRSGQNYIIGILDSNLNQIVSYEYDSWGNILSIKDENGNEITSSTHIGIINPYRYRSYRYDSEIGLYYLQSRYYNPEWGRFINFDNYGGQVGNLLSHNGYIYCINNPVNMIDENGNWARLLTALLAVVLIVVTFANTIPQDTGADIGDAITETAIAIEDTISSVVTNIKNKKKTTTKTQTQTVTQTTTKTKDNEGYNYNEADLIAGNVVIGKPISYDEALARVNMNQNIMCKNEYFAEKIAKNFPRAIGPEIDKNRKPGKTYYKHYHIHGKPHIWFYDEP